MTRSATFHVDDEHPGGCPSCGHDEAVAYYGRAPFHPAALFTRCTSCEAVTVFHRRRRGAGRPSWPYLPALPVAHLQPYSQTGDIPPADRPEALAALPYDPADPVAVDVLMPCGGFLRLYGASVTHTEADGTVDLLSVRVENGDGEDIGVRGCPIRVTPEDRVSVTGFAPYAALI